MLHRRSDLGSIKTRLIAALVFGTVLLSCGSAPPPSSNTQSRVSLEATDGRPCLRVPSGEQLAAARSAVEQITGEAGVPVEVSLNCGGAQSILYLINAINKGIVYQRLDATNIPRTVDCCNGIVPLELNPSILAAPLYYFALDDDAERARYLAAKTSGDSFFDFNERRSEHPLKAPDGLYQPGYVVFRGGIPREGACVIIVNLADRFQRPDRAEYRVDHQTFACIAKLLGNVNMRTPRVIPNAE